MISAFENMVRRYPQRTCFTFVNEAGEETAYSYREVRMLSAALARHFQAKGVQRGQCISVDLPNCPLYVLLTLAAAYGNFTLVALNNRLTSPEKLSRLLELDRCPDVHIALRVDEGNATALFQQALTLFAGEERADVTSTHAARLSFTARNTAATASARSTRALGRAKSQRAVRRRQNETARQDALEEIIHFAERSSHVFDAKTRAVIMFTSGSTGKPKAVPLSWGNIVNAAKVSNAALNKPGEGMWQAALPLYHIGGFQVVVRSLLGFVPFILYATFDAKRLLSDALLARVTHVSVVDKMLQDMLAENNSNALQSYRCILLGGAAANAGTLARAVAEGIRVYASYGMTETASQIAHEQVTASFKGGLRLLPGYDVRIVDADEQGFGRLAVKGPGVFAGYLNARAAYTVDGFFLTGDTAALANSRLYVKERTADMFISGGENIYPAEILDKLVRVPGVADAYVFGAADATWGRRPVAFVERAKCSEAKPEVLPRETITPQQFGSVVRGSLVSRLSRLYQPRHICVLDTFPRTSMGKIDRAALEACYDQRLEVKRVTLYRIRLPFNKPFKTAKGIMQARESILVEVEDHAGRTGIGECVAFPTDWYLPETLNQDARVLESVLAPLVLQEVYLHPCEVSASFATCQEAMRYPLAQGAIEPALWDLYGKIVGKPLWQLIGGKPPCSAKSALSAGSRAEGVRNFTMSEVGALRVPGEASVANVSSVPMVSTAASSACVSADTPGIAIAAGAVIGIASPQETVQAARRCVEAGYRRVKLKVAPGNSVAAVRAVREEFPQLMITLDANQSFSERDAEELQALDNCNVAWIEEPLDPHRLPVVGPTDVFARLARLQRNMKTPLCLDESIAYPQDLSRALRQPELRCYAVKIAKMGGVQPTLDFVHAAHARGLALWMGGMYDTGVSKRLHAAFQTLPGIEAPGDIGATSRYFNNDITIPPYTVERGYVTLNRAGHEYGLGCQLNHTVLSTVLIERTVIGN